MSTENEEPEFIEIFVKWITLRNGKRLYAHQKGLKAFKIKVKSKKKPKQ